MAVNSELEELLSDAPMETAAADAQQETQQTQAVEANQARDDQGRFAQKQPEQPSSSDVGGQPDSHGQNGGVPVKAVQDEREKRQEAQKRADDLERQLAELRGQVSVLTQVRQPQQQQQQQKPVTLWDDPDTFLREQMSPFQSEIQQMREELWESRASASHGAEKVEAAKKAAESIFGTPAGRALHQQITSSGNPFDNLVKWHQQQQAISTVGDNPDAWFQTKLDQMLSDPAEQTKIIDRIRAGAAPNQNNGKPLTNLPPTLSRLPASSATGSDDGDMSDGALFSHAMGTR